MMRTLALAAAAIAGTLGFFAALLVLALYTTKAA